MDTTITYDEVDTLVGVNIPSLKVPKFRANPSTLPPLRVSVATPPMPTKHLTWWEDMVMARELYALLMPMPFHLPNDPGVAAIYVCLVMAGQPVNATLLTRTEQPSIDTRFARAKHYLLSMRNIERVCFTALNASVNDAFKVSNDPTIQGLHAGMQVIDILDQLSTIYGQPTPAVLEMNNTVFRSLYLVANAPEVLFCRIEECAEMALLGRNPDMDCQL
jgi:hypothetical protein